MRMKEREFLKFIKCHPHGKNAGSDISESVHLIPKNGAGYLVLDEPDIRFNIFDLASANGVLCAFEEYELFKNGK